MPKRKLRAYICKSCDRVFYTIDKKRRGLCDMCKLKISVPLEAPVVLPKPKRTGHNLSEKTKEIETYNKNHKTHHTYGQYLVLEMFGRLEED